MLDDGSLLKTKLENLISKYQNISYLETDPICFPKQYKNPLDIELVSLISCLFAYGNVKNIQNFLKPIFLEMGTSPYEFLVYSNPSFSKFLNSQKGYRFQTKEDVIVFFLTLQRILTKKKQTSPLFESYFLDTNGRFDQNTSIQNFQKQFETELISTLKTETLSYGLQFLIGKWKSKSPKKRISLFLRWMVRNDYPDFGLYQNIKPNQIPYPMDVHIQKLIKVLGIKNQKQIQLNDAFLLTEFFKKINSNDPLLYDFYLTRVGIIDKCRGSFEEKICKVCELREVCLVVPRGIEPRLQG
ncbi:TIGR02757 family protein [Leptospira biflexa]|uniref:TIGR02757 family protein n=1 Tax=Leptospira biflexa TaxID=172 RepID=UPI0010835809|nr:TIGR02757 family protein [Leptospira biflexa]TGM36892.1 TIGR02757 family protein [Leptospira biflexa]TGM40320.1 TIGR02757 family protein [Leptospira biflexa]